MYQLFTAKMLLTVQLLSVATCLSLLVTRPCLAQDVKTNTESKPQKETPVPISDDVLARIGNDYWDSIPFAYAGGYMTDALPVVNVKINSASEQVPFLFTTSFSHCMVFPEIVKRFGLPRDGAHKSQHVVTIELLELGEYSFDIAMLVLEDQSVIAGLQKVDSAIKGVLGANIIRDYAIYINYRDRRIWIFRKGLSADKIRRLTSEGKLDMVSVPLRNDNDRFLVTMNFGKEPVRLFISNGFAKTRLFTDALKRRKITYQTEGESKTMNDTRGSEVTLQPVLGALTLPQDTSVSFAPWHVSTVPTPSTFDGYLGNDFLSQHNILLDFPNNRMYIERPKKKSIPAKTAADKITLP